MKRLIARFRRSTRTSQEPRCTAIPNAAPVPTEYKVETSEAEHESTLKPKMMERNRDCRLDILPPEVRRHLLSILDLPRLKALVHASPTFHQQYLEDRKYILCKSLEETLGSVTVDAYAIHMFATQDANINQDLTGFFESCSEERLLRYLPLVNKLTQDDATSMVAFHLRCVNPIAGYYARWALDNLAKETGKDSSDYRQEIALTLTEAMRFTRAVYRFQLLCQLADPIRSSRHKLIHVQAFLDTLKAWEIEELFSFYQFARGKFEEIFNNIRWDVHPDNPKFDDQGRPPTPEGAFDLDSSVERDNFLEGTTLRGTSLLHTVLFEIKDHEHLVSLMQRHISSSYVPLNVSEGVFGETQQAIRRRDHPSEQDQMQEERVPCQFCGDGEPDTPPLAWTIIWGDTYSNLYGCYTLDEMRRWGYIFWDAARLESTGAREVLRRQWEESWGDEDPRDNLF
ncbi:hypothetical protein ACQKWADRAFT_307934 [Trichoderma austrokoningii]